MSICSTAISKEGSKVAAPTGLKPLSVTVRQARELLGVGNTTIWALIRDKKLRTVNVGRRRLVVYASLESIVEPSA
jgi:excisionase family DNA binding protein